MKPSSYQNCWSHEPKFNKDEYVTKQGLNNEGEMRSTLIA